MAVITSTRPRLAFSTTFSKIPSFLFHRGKSQNISRSQPIFSWLSMLGPELYILIYKKMKLYSPLLPLCFRRLSFFRGQIFSRQLLRPHAVLAMGYTRPCWRANRSGILVHLPALSEWDRPRIATLLQSKRQLHSAAQVPTSVLVLCKVRNVHFSRRAACAPLCLLLIFAALSYS